MFITKKDVKILTGALIIIVVAIIISLVYAGFTGQLNITGTSTARQSNWDIHFENLSTVTTTGSAKALTQPRLDGNTSIEDYDVTVTSPGDSISFTFKVVNDGNYDAEISSLSIGTPTCTGTDATSNTNVCGKLTYTLTDENGASIQVGDTLLAKDSKIMKVTLLYQEFSDASLLPTADVSIGGLGITINYEQSGSALVKDDGTVANYRVYHQGDKITLNNEDYWVIEDSGAGQDYVVALKDLPLTTSEVNLYGGVGTENNHVNRYTQSSVGTSSGGKLAYYSSETCGYVNNSLIYTNCNNNYDESDIKYIVDNWGNIKFSNNQLKEIDNYKARLITAEELVNKLGCTSNNCSNSSYAWTYSSNYWYWTMSKSGDSKRVRYVIHTGLVGEWDIYAYDRGTVRPVINVYKSAIETNTQ